MKRSGILEARRKAVNPAIRRKVDEYFSELDRQYESTHELTLHETRNE